MEIAESKAAAEAMRAHHAQAASKVIGPAGREGAPRVVFYQLGRKFVDDEREIPKESEEVMYYTLAVGHHTGIIDCFDEKVSCPLDVYRNTVAMLPQGDARYKLEGILRSGEIQVDKSHVKTLDAPVKELLANLEAQDDPAHAAARSWLAGFSASLDAISGNPAIYLMGRERS
jgi:hypothetical protein